MAGPTSSAWEWSFTSCSPAAGPFRGTPKRNCLSKSSPRRPAPLRQQDDAIPRELERICLKALAKRASERYLTAKDLAEDIRQFLASAVLSPGAGPMPMPASAVGPHADAGTLTPAPEFADRRSAEHSSPSASFPRACGNFDAGDANFFLELLPGPRDRDESAGFHPVSGKTVLNPPKPAAPSPLDLLYGPSGFAANRRWSRQVFFAPSRRQRPGRLCRSRRWRALKKG